MSCVQGRGCGSTAAGLTGHSGAWQAFWASLGAQGSDLRAWDPLGNAIFPSYHLCYAITPG